MAKIRLKRNMNQIDRSIRIITGLAMIYFGFIDQSLIGNTTIAIIVGVFGIVSIIFAILAFCPIYSLGNVSTATSSESNTNNE